MERASERTNSINKRIYERNIPSQQLQAYLDFRATPTKYALFPVVDLRAPVITPFYRCETFNNEKIFNPGDKSPWSEYASNINVESSLRNEYSRYQKCGYNVYIPDSHSSLYHNNIPSPLYLHGERLYYDPERKWDLTPFELA
jgi:hypothetical protein